MREVACAAYVASGRAGERARGAAFLGYATELLFQWKARTHAHEGTTKHAKLSIPIPPYKMAHTLSCRRVVSRWLCLGNADTTRLASSFAITRQSEVGRGGGKIVFYVYFVFQLIYLYNCCFSAFTIFFCLARTFSNFIAYFYSTFLYFHFSFTENSMWKIFPSLCSLCFSNNNLFHSALVECFVN